MNRKVKLIAPTLLFALMAIILISCNRPIERSEYSTREVIYEESKSVIMEQLLSPTSAIFPDFESTFVVDNGKEIVYEEIVYHTYTVNAYVDSHNAFGTMIRQKYQVIIGLPSNSEDAGTVYYEIVYLE